MNIISQAGQQEIEISPRQNTVYIKFNGHCGPGNVWFETERLMDWTALTSEQQSRLQEIAERADALLKEAAGVML